MPFKISNLRILASYEAKICNFWTFSSVIEKMVYCTFGIIKAISSGQFPKGREWIRLLFAYPSTLNNGAPIGSAHCILGVPAQVSPCSVQNQYGLR